MLSRWFAGFVLSLGLGAAYAQSSACVELNGALVFGQDSQTTYLGFFGSRYAPDSIDNPFGLHGSRFALASVRNPNGNFGSTSSNFSANNNFASRPPVIVKRGQPIGLLTSNTSLSGGISLAAIDANCTFTAVAPDVGNAAPPPPPAAPPPPPPAGTPQVLVDSGLAGLWWNPNRGGEGLNLDFTLGSTPGSSLMLLTFYTYDTEGFPIFLIGAVQVEEGQVEAQAEVSLAQGPRFGPGYRASDLETISLGVMQFRFNSCSSISMRFVPSPAAQQAGFLGFESPLQRFTPRQPWHTCLGVE